MAQEPLISVITVSYRSAGDCARLASSLATDGSDGLIEWLIVNNSPDEPITLPATVQPWTTIVTAANPGYGAAVNIAVHRARGKYLFLANPDLLVASNLFSTAAAYLDAHTDIGILLPRLLHPDGTVQQSVRRFYTWRAALWARCPLRDRVAHPRFFRQYLMLDEIPSEPIDVDWGLGGAMFLRRADFEHTPIFDERFFLYFEDVDLCLRMWNEGRRVVYHPSLHCAHDHRRASKGLFSPAARHHLRSTLRFIFKHGGFPSRPSRESRR